MSLKKIFFILFVFVCLLVYAKPAKAFEVLGKCGCIMGDESEKVFDDTESSCKQWPAIAPNTTGSKEEFKSCNWVQVAQAGCFCKKFTPNAVSNFFYKAAQGKSLPTDNVQKIGVAKEACTPSSTDMYGTYLDCSWYDPQVNNGCVCNIAFSAFGKTTPTSMKVVLTSVTSEKDCKTTMPANGPFEFTNCKVEKNAVATPTESSTGADTGGTDTSGTGNSGGVDSVAPANSSIVLDENYFKNLYPRPDNYKGPLPDCAFSGTCRDTNDFVVLLINFGQMLLSVIGALAFVFFVYGGFTMILSMGNAEKTKKGQQILVSAVVGLVIAFSAYLGVNFILDSLQVTSEFRPGGSGAAMTAELSKCNNVEAKTAGCDTCSKRGLGYTCTDSECESGTEEPGYCLATGQEKKKCCIPKQAANTNKNVCNCTVVEKDTLGNPQSMNFDLPSGLKKCEDIGTGTVLEDGGVKWETTSPCH